MIFYGFNKITLLDYPEKIACTLFLAGCNMLCPYCHNSQLIEKNNFIETYKEEDILNFLEKRKSKLEGVCITGGEPLLYNDLSGFIKKIKELGFLVKLDTNGTLSEKLIKLCQEVVIDYIAMDIKTSLEKYKLLTKNNEDFTKEIKQSIDFIINSGIDHEFRTTVAPIIVEFEDLEKISQLIKGCKNYYLAKFKASEFAPKEYWRNNKNNYSLEILEKMRDFMLSKNINCKLRANY